jgi:hypothetical protein
MQTLNAQRYVQRFTFILKRFAFSLVLVIVKTTAKLCAALPVAISFISQISPIPVQTISIIFQTRTAKITFLF